MDRKRFLKGFVKYIWGILLLGCLTGCGMSGKEQSEDFMAMDTIMSIRCIGKEAKEALEACEAEVHRLDSLLSTGESTSEVSAINQGKTMPLSDDVWRLLQQSQNLYQQTDGAFDITVYPLMEAWGFLTGDFRVPSEEQLRQAKLLCDGSQVSLNEGDYTLTLGQGQKIDFGAIAKGYTSDRLVGILTEKKVNSAFLSLGGNVYCYGTKPDGSLWKVGIRNPFLSMASAETAKEEEAMAGVLSVADTAVVTSGSYIRYFTDEETGKVYHHIMDPATGYPADNELVSVTIVCGNGALADGLSTACFIMGVEKTISYWRQYQEIFDFVLITKDRKVYVTKSLQNSFETQWECTVVE